MYKYVNLVLLFLTASMMTAQQSDFNLELLFKVTYPEGCNDIWGYVDDNGIEYALLGTRTATIVLSLEDPSNPEELLRVDGDQSTWRDIKVFADRAYVTTDDGDDGLLIINLDDIENDNLTFAYQNTVFTYNGGIHQLEECHNIYIDTVTGVMFLSGCDAGDNGVLMFDLTVDPDNPQFIGAEDRFYSHDNMARGDTLYTSDLTQGFSIWDVSDPASPVELGRKITTTEFAHNGWVSDDGKYFFTTDERANAFVDAYDITDPSDIELLDAYRPITTEGRGVIPHNTHYYDGYLVTSWYTDGVKVLDASRPHNLIEVGSYDSWLGQDGGFNGCWGAYPWLPSGLILASDIQEGLLVLQPNYQRGCYLEGIITNNLDFNPVMDVDVTILGNFENAESSNFNGEYATGQAESGTFDVRFTHPDYQDTVISVDLVNGQVTQLDVELRAKPFFRVDINVIDAVSKQAIPQAEVLLSNEFRSEGMTADMDGNLELIIFEDQSNVYDIFAGKWGYLHGLLEDADLGANTSYTIELKEGYQDDFIFDQGWTVTGAAPRGIWTRANPTGTSVNGQIANPEDDVDTDYGADCYVTGNAGGNAGQDDVDDGSTIVTSPVMDLARFTNPEILFKTWFFNGSRPNPNDSLVVRLSNGIDEVTIHKVEASSSVWSDTIRIDVSQFIAATENMTLSVTCADDFNNGHIVEGGFDEFRVLGDLSTSNADQNFDLIRVNPTLVSDVITISQIPQEEVTLKLIDINGQILDTRIINGTSFQMNIGALPSGTYVLYMESQSGWSMKEQVVKQ